jgi:ADP-ribosylglycohydrolase
MDPTELRTLFSAEVTQRREEGCDVHAFESLPIEAFSESTLHALYADLDLLDPAPDWPHEEPSTLHEIHAARPDGPRTLPPCGTDKNLKERLLGAWLGRSAGCLLGKPVEGWPRERIEKLLAAAGKTELDDYCPDIAFPDGPDSYPDEVRPWLAGHIESMPRDDDMDYTILGLLALEKHGEAFTASDIGALWLDLLPYSRVYTAEYITYRNYANGLRPPRTAEHMNPYREWIGGQIRADIWGYVNPGQPERAAEFAFRDASLSHVKNGIYGEMFVAAALAAVLGGADVPSALEIGLSEIPERSRFTEMAHRVRDWCGQHSDWKAVWERIEEHYGAYHPVHTINNAAYVIAALLLAGDDFEKAITIAVACGLDTDCNGATAGSIMGAFLGAKRLPGKWIDLLNDTIRSDLVGHATMKISDLAERTVKQAEAQSTW